MLFPKCKSGKVYSSPYTCEDLFLLKRRQNKKEGINRQVSPLGISEAVPPNQILL